MGRLVVCPPSLHFPNRRRKVPLPSFFPWGLGFDPSFEDLSLSFFSYGLEGNRHCWLVYWAWSICKYYRAYIRGFICSLTFRFCPFENGEVWLFLYVSVDFYFVYAEGAVFLSCYVVHRLRYSTVPCWEKSKVFWSFMLVFDHSLYDRVETLLLLTNGLLPCFSERKSGLLLRERNFELRKIRAFRPIIYRTSPRCRDVWAVVVKWPDLWLDTVFFTE